MAKLAAIAIGGAAGSVLRYGVYQGIHTLVGRGFPWGTLVVNSLGSLLVGFIFVYLVERSAVSDVLRAALFIGLLGGFTTFSTFSLETLVLIEEASYFKAVVNIFISVVLCLGGAWLGMTLARQ
ncbi:MAG: fluoride efflux transporter CrcB [Acidiferrobacteraceae bacterium]|nr:fluoride efflux transporter CrcB [Acidiferrobacteraceae bacterium]